MIELRSIRNYMETTVQTLAIATGMEVIICDENCLILADSNYEETKDEDFRENHEILSRNSIVRQCVDTKQILLISDCKRDNPACWNCVNSKTCVIRAIIAYPIMADGAVIGGIGLYAADSEAQMLLNEKSGLFDKFVQRICEMILSKAKERQTRLAFESTSERLRLLIESLDEAIVGFDEAHNIININSRLYKIFNVHKKTIKSLSDIYDLLPDSKLKNFFSNCIEEKSPQKTVLSINGNELMISYKPVLVNEEYRGALLYFKKSSDIYRDVRAIKENAYYSVTFDDIVGTSQAMEQLKDSAKHFAKGPSTIFIQGRSGTGKEMFARAIHNESLVSKGAFVAVNCAAIPETLLESELFGHKEGAFTGSMRGGKIGKFEMADKGTLFLDEIGEMPLHLQPKLLRAIQEKRIQPVGSNSYIPVDIRIIAATNRNLEDMVARGEFREDLFYRLNVIPLYIPELAGRRGDIPELLDVFLEKYNSLLDKNIIGFDLESKKILCEYDWPGNIRELQNVVEYAVNDCRGSYIAWENLPQRKFLTHQIPEELELQSLKEIEKMYIREALRKYGKSSNGKTAAAKALGISRATFYRKLSEMDLD